MARMGSLVLAALLCPAGAALAQPPAPPVPADSSAQGTSSEAGAAAVSAAADPQALQLAADTVGVSTGMPVQNESGEALGFVVDVLPGPEGTEESGYAVIAGTGGITPVPYGTARSLVHDGTVVIGQARFAGAPRVPQSQIEDPSASAWKAKVNSYWESSAAPPPAREPTHEGQTQDGQTQDEQTQDEQTEHEQTQDEPQSPADTDRPPQP
jgi:hypothetical protein